MFTVICVCSGDQPLFNEDKSVSVCVNGEIYNHKELKAQILEKHPNKKFATESDCEVRPSAVDHLSRLHLGCMNRAFLL